DSVRPHTPTVSAVEPPRNIPLKPSELTEEEKACASGIVLSRDPDSHHFFVSAPLVDEALVPDNPDDYVAMPAAPAAPIEEIGAPYATPIDEDDIDLGEPMPPYDGEPVYDDDEHIDSTDVPDSLIAAVSTDQPAVVDVPRGAAEASEAPVDIATKVADVATESAIE